MSFEIPFSFYENSKEVISEDDEITGILLNMESERSKKEKINYISKMVVPFWATQFSYFGGHDLINTTIGVTDVSESFTTELQPLVESWRRIIESAISEDQSAGKWKVKKKVVKTFNKESQKILKLIQKTASKKGNKKELLLINQLYRDCLQDYLFKFIPVDDNTPEIIESYDKNKILQVKTNLDTFYQLPAKFEKKIAEICADTNKKREEYINIYKGPRDEIVTKFSPQIERLRPEVERQINEIKKNYEAKIENAKNKAASYYEDYQDAERDLAFTNSLGLGSKTEQKDKFDFDVLGILGKEDVTVESDLARAERQISNRALNRHQEWKNKASSLENEMNAKIKAQEEKINSIQRKINSECAHIDEILVPLNEVMQSFDNIINSYLNTAKELRKQYYFSKNNFAKFKGTVAIVSLNLPLYVAKYENESNGKTRMKIFSPMCSSLQDKLIISVRAKQLAKLSKELEGMLKKDNDMAQNVESKSNISNILSDSSKKDALFRTIPNLLTRKYLKQKKVEEFRSLFERHFQ